MFLLSKMFICHNSCPSYERIFCNYATHAKVRKLNCNRGVRGYVAKTIFKRCRQCKVGSYSFGCRFYHKKKCVSNLQTIKNNDLMKNLIKYDPCDFKTSRKKHLKLHKKEAHRLRDLFQCDQHTNNNQNLGFYKNRKPTLFELRKTFNCDECEYKSKQKYDLKGHKQRKHNLILRFQCDLCQYSANTATNLKYHKKN